MAPKRLEQTVYIVKIHNIMKIRVLLFGVALAISHALPAEPVAPQVMVDHEISMQSGPGKRARITRKIESGTRLTVLNQSASGHYTRVQLETGVDGWVLSSDLTAIRAPEQISAPSQVQLPASAEELRGMVAQLQTELNTVRQASVSALAVQGERDQLQETVIRLKRENETLTRDNSALEDEQGQSWFLVGAGVALGGIFIGLFLPQLNLRRRNNWNTF